MLQLVQIYEQLKENASFKRVARSFEIYQKALQEEGADIEALKNRMHEVYQAKISTDTIKEKGKTRALEYTESNIPFFTYALTQAEQGTFTMEEFTKESIRMGVAETLLENWAPKIGKGEGGEIHINELMYYTEEKDGKVSVHINPSGVKSENLIPKVLEGFQMIAKSIKEGTLTSDTVSMTSWLLNKGFEPTVKMLFPKANLHFEELPDEERGVANIQNLALTFNGRSLNEFLKTGQRPPVRRLTLSADEFVGALAA